MRHEHTDLKHAQLFPAPKKPIKRAQTLEEYRQKRLETLQKLAEERVKERRQSLHAVLASLVLFAAFLFVITDAAAKRAETAEICRAFQQEMAR